MCQTLCNEFYIHFLCLLVHYNIDYSGIHCHPFNRIIKQMQLSPYWSLEGCGSMKLRNPPKTNIANVLGVRAVRGAGWEEGYPERLCRVMLELRAPK